MPKFISIMMNAKCDKLLYTKCYAQFERCCRYCRWQQGHCQHIEHISKHISVTDICSFNSFRFGSISDFPLLIVYFQRALTWSRWHRFHSTLVNARYVCKWFVTTTVSTSSVANAAASFFCCCVQVFCPYNPVHITPARFDLFSVSCWLFAVNVISSFLCFGNSSAYWLCCSLMDRTHQFFLLFLLASFYMVFGFLLLSRCSPSISCGFGPIFSSAFLRLHRFTDQASISLAGTKAISFTNYLIRLTSLFCFYLTFFRFSYWPTIHAFKCLWLRQGNALRVDKDIKTESTNWKVK